MNNVSFNCPTRNITFGDSKESSKTTTPLNPTISGVPLRGTKRLNMPPLAIGAINGFCWYSAGMILDKLVSKICKTKTNSKLAIAFNSLLALTTGYNAYKVAKREVKQA